MKTRKILALLSAFTMIGCMTACGDKDSSSKKEIQTETVAAENGSSADEESADKDISMVNDLTKTDESSAVEEILSESSEEASDADSSAADNNGSFTEDDVNDIMNGYDKDNAQDTVVALLEKGFSSAFGDNMKVNYDESTKTYELSVWQSGFAAALDTDAGVSALKTMSSQLTSALSTMESQIQMLDSNSKLKFNFLSDKDQSTPLLVIENGQITYDITAQ